MLRTLSPLKQGLSYEDESLLPSQKSTVTCSSGHGQK